MKIVFTVPLDLVHGDVGIAYESIRTLAVIRVDGNADAGGRPEFIPCHSIGVLEIIDDLAGNNSCIRLAMEFGEQGGKLVSPLPGKSIAGADAASQAEGYISEQFIPLGMPMGIIDQLEAVKIDKHDCQPDAVPFCLNNGQLQPVPKKPPVRQMSQVIVQGLKADGLFRQLPFRYVPGDSVSPQITLCLFGNLSRKGITLVDPDGAQHGNDLPVIENPVDPLFLAFEADFQVRCCPVIAAPFIEGKDRPLSVIIMDNGKIGTADQFFP